MSILYKATAETNTDLPSAVRLIKSPEISYSVANLEHSQPYFTEKSTKSGLRTHTVSLASSTETAFVFDPLTYNLSEFVLHYKVTVGLGLATNYAHTAANVVPIQTVELKGQRTGTVLAKINNAYAYCSQVAKIESTKSAFLSRARRYGPNRPSHSYDEKKNLFYDGSDAKVANLEIKYTETGIAHNAGAPVELKDSERYFRFGDIFKNTVLGLNKMWYTPEPLELTITWMPATGWTHIGTASANPATGATALLTDLELSELYIDMCHEQSSTNVDKDCRLAVQQGTVISTPTVVGMSQQLVANSEGSCTFNINGSMGPKLAKVYMVPTLAAPVANTRHSYDNTDGVRISQYQTRFNSVNIQPVPVKVSTGIADWNLNRKRLENSALVNIDVYRRNWTIIDDFSGCSNDSKAILPYEEDSLFVGRDINPRDTYELIATVGAAAVNIMAFFVGSQRMEIRPEGIIVR